MLRTTTTAKPQRLTLQAADGVALAIESRGGSAEPALVFAHGFGQTRHAWDASATTLAESCWHCLTMDARGHGDSGWRADGHYEFAQFVDDLARLARVPARKPILVGASMGGLLGLVAQAEHDVFRALVLVDITPRWEAAGVERILTFMRAHPQGFADVEEASAAIAHYLPHRAQRYSRDQSRPERLRKLLVTGENGRLHWHWDPRLLDTIAVDSEREQARLLDAARRIRVPVLLVSGERSDVVSDATIDEFLHCVPHARHVRVNRATHMIAGDENAAFTSAVATFVAPLRNNRIEDRP